MQRHAGGDSLAFATRSRWAWATCCCLLLLLVPRPTCWCARKNAASTTRASTCRGPTATALRRTSWPAQRGGGGASAAAGPTAVSTPRWDAVGDAGSRCWARPPRARFDGLGAADEGRHRHHPVLAVFGAVLAALFGAGWLLLLYFGSEALLAAAVELAFAYTAARTVVRVEREGWLLAATSA